MGPVYSKINTRGATVYAIARIFFLAMLVVTIATSARGMAQQPYFPQPSVKLASFTVKDVGTRKIQLQWVTAHEKNASHFTIERSLNGIDFLDAAIIFSSGDSDQSKSYSFTDKLKADGKGRIFYRLKMVDLQGNVSYSQVRSLRLDGFRTDVI